MRNFDKHFLKRTIVIPALVTMLACCGHVVAGDRSGTVSGQFLKLPLDARAVGMGGAQVAIADGVTSIGFNPAGITSISDYGAAVSYTSWFANIQYSYFGFVKNISGLGEVGISAIGLTTDDMIETTPAAPEGTGRTFKASDYAFSAVFARQVTEQFSVGVNAKVVQSYLFNTELGASTFAVDIGTLYDIPQLRSRIGVSLTNIGKDMNFIQETYSLPTALRFGVLIDMYKSESNSLQSTFQIVRINDADEQYNVGAEYMMNSVFAVRGGWKFSYDEENFTAGFGVKMHDIMGLNGGFDYGYNNFVDLPGTHSLTLEVQF
ncbi:MAG TPA: PorV/PorQ family protein [Bacteroidota bacterium]|nr:PorV/PorQ family protein [Bacteroidota bacterium]